MPPVKSPAQSPVYFRTLKNKPPSFTERDYFFHNTIFSCIFFCVFCHFIFLFFLLYGLYNYSVTVPELGGERGSLSSEVRSDVLLALTSTLAKSSCPVKTLSFIITGVVLS